MDLNTNIKFKKIKQFKMLQKMFILRISFMRMYTPIHIKMIREKIIILMKILS